MVFATCIFQIQRLYAYFMFAAQRVGTSSALRNSFMGGVKPEPDEALTMQIYFAIWLKTQAQNPFCPCSGWGKKYGDGFKSHFLESAPYHFIEDDFSLPPVIGKQYKCQVCIPIFVLETSPTCELTFDQDSPGAISKLFPLRFFTRHPFSAFVFVETIV